MSVVFDSLSLWNTSVTQNQVGIRGEGYAICDIGSNSGNMEIKKFGRRRVTSNTPFQPSTNDVYNNNDNYVAMVGLSYSDIRNLQRLTTSMQYVTQG